MDRVILNWQKTAYLCTRQLLIFGCSIIIGLPQESISSESLFIRYVNDLIKQCNCGSDIFLYADATKLCHYIKSAKDCQVLQEDLNKENAWLKKWFLKLKINTFKVT